MLLPESGARLWLYAPPTDMRKSFDGLSALVRQKLAENPTSGELFVFINRRCTQLKVLYFEQGGYCLWSKRLEAGGFHFNAQGGDKQALSSTDLKRIIENPDQLDPSALLGDTPPPTEPEPTEEITCCRRKRKQRNRRGCCLHRPALRP